MDYKNIAGFCIYKIYNKYMVYSFSLFVFHFEDNKILK